MSRGFPRRRSRSHPHVAPSGQGSRASVGRGGALSGAGGRREGRSVRTVSGVGGDVGGHDGEQEPEAVAGASLREWLRTPRCGGASRRRTLGCRGA